MTQIIQIKRSTTTVAPSTLAQGELAYSDQTSKLFIGSATNGTILTIGGKIYVDMLDHTAGVLTASSAIVVDSNKKIDNLIVDNIDLNGNTISSTTGNLVLSPSSNLVINSSSVDISAQATEFKVLDGSSTAFTISEDTNNYITIDTTNSSEKIVFNKQLSLGLDGSSGYTMPVADGTIGQALITNGSGAVTFTTISTELDIAGDTGTDTVSLVSDTLTFTGGEGIDATVTNNTVTIAAELASSANKGVASFDAVDFTVTTGVVAVNAITLGTSTLNPGATTSSITGLNSIDVDNINIDSNTISSTNTNGDITLSPNGEGTVQVPSGYKDRANFGTNSLVSKSYVDAVQQGLGVKDSVRVGTTGNLTATYNNANGTLTNSAANTALSLDSITLSTSDRVIVKDQSNAVQNGIYDITTLGSGAVAWVLTRSSDADLESELTGGTFVFVEEGTDNANNGFVFTHNGTPTFGTTDLTVSQFSGAGQINAGGGLTKSGNTLEVNDDNISTEISSDNIRIKGISSTAAGDLMYGSAANGGFNSLVKPSAGDVTTSNYLLSMDTSGNPVWGNVLDGGTY